MIDLLANAFTWGPEMSTSPYIYIYVYIPTFFKHCMMQMKGCMDARGSAGINWDVCQQHVPCQSDASKANPWSNSDQSCELIDGWNQSTAQKSWETPRPTNNIEQDTQDSQGMRDVSPAIRDSFGPVPYKKGPKYMSQSLIVSYSNSVLIPPNKISPKTSGQ